MPMTSSQAEDELWDLAVVGAGTTAAYYLSTLRMHKYPRILVIGDEDPWARQRGYQPAEEDSNPLNNLNHPWEMLRHYLDHYSELFDRSPYDFSGNQMADRLDWAARNREFITYWEMFPESAMFHYALGKVTKIQRRWRLFGGHTHEVISMRAILGDRHDYTFNAKKAVLATGTFGDNYRKPPRLVDFETFHGRPPDYACVDLNGFAEMPWNDVTGPVVVLGPNAAIDAANRIVVQCLRTGRNVMTHWFLPAGWITNRLPLLATQGDLVTGLKEGTANIRFYPLTDPDVDVTFYRRSLVARVADVSARVDAIENSGIRRNLVVESGLREISMQPGACFVYAMGFEQTGMKEMLDPILAEAKAMMQPIYDDGLRFGKLGSSALGYHVEAEGWQTEFEVVGMASPAITRILAEKLGTQDARNQLWTAIANLQDAYLAHSSLPDWAMEWLVMTPQYIDAQSYGDLNDRLTLFLGLFSLKGADPSYKPYFTKLAHLILSYKLSAEAMLADDRKKAKVYQDRMNAPAKTLSSAMVADAGQASTIKAVMAALNDFLSNDLDLNTDDRVMVESFIALYFPAISPAERRNFVAKIIQERHAAVTAAYFGKADHLMAFQELAGMNRMAQGVRGSRSLEEEAEEDRAAELRKDLWMRIRPLLAQLDHFNRAYLYELLVPKTMGSMSVAESE